MAILTANLDYSIQFPAVRPLDVPILLNPHSWQARGLVLCVPVAQGAVYDLKGNVNFALQSGPKYVGATIGGAAARFDATDAAYIATIPAYQKIGLPVVMSCWFRNIGTPAVNSGVCGSVYDTGINAPYVAAVTLGSDGTQYFFAYTNGSSFLHNGAWGALSSEWRHFLGVLTSAEVTAYVNGVQVNSGAPSSPVPTYSATSYWYIGADYTGIGRLSNHEVFDFRIYNTDFSLGERLALYQQPWDLYQPSFMGTGFSFTPAANTWPGAFINAGYY